MQTNHKAQSSTSYQRLMKANLGIQNEAFSSLLTKFLGNILPFGKILQPEVFNKMVVVVPIHTHYDIYYEIFGNTIKTFIRAALLALTYTANHHCTILHFQLAMLYQ